MREIDQIAKFDVKNKFVLPECLHLPIAAKDKSAISRFVGDILTDLSDCYSEKAFIVSVSGPIHINNALAIWKEPRSIILHENMQIWVDVDYNKYREAYKKAFPMENISAYVLDHVMNRRIARLKGFKYLRIVPISRSANSSSGALSEKWGVEYHSSEYMRKVNKEKGCFIQYADLGDIVKMLGVKIGGGVMDIVNDAQELLNEI